MTDLVPEKDCTKCGHSYPATREFFDWSERDGLSARCKDCRKKKTKAHYADNKGYYFDLAEARRKEMAAFIVSLKDKPCFDCGHEFPYFVMDFDHREGKTMNVSHPKVKRWSKEKILAEVAKCDLVCSNCHRIRTHFRGQHLRQKMI